MTTSNFSGIEKLKIGSPVRFIVNGAENKGTILDINPEGGTVRVEVVSQLQKGATIKIWVPYFLIILDGR